MHLIFFSSITPYLHTLHTFVSVANISYMALALDASHALESDTVVQVCTDNTCSHIPYRDSATAKPCLFPAVRPATETMAITKYKMFTGYVRKTYLTRQAVFFKIIFNTSRERGGGVLFHDEMMY